MNEIVLFFLSVLIRIIQIFMSKMLVRNRFLSNNCWKCHEVPPLVRQHVSWYWYGIYVRTAHPDIPRRRTVDLKFIATSKVCYFYLFSPWLRQLCYFGIADFNAAAISRLLASLSCAMTTYSTYVERTSKRGATRLRYVLHSTYGT